MLFNKLFNYIAAMPSGTINIQPDRVPTQSLVQMPQNFHESAPVAFFRTNHSIAPKKRSNPAGHVQAFTMLAGRCNTQPDALFGPAPTKTGVQRKTRLILKNDCLLRPQFAEFFLTYARTFEHPLISLEHTNNRHVSSGIPDDASIFEPASPSGLCQSISSGEWLRLGRPTALGSGQNPGESSLNEQPGFSEPYSLVSLGVQSVAWVLRTPALLRSHRVTNGSSSSVSDRKLRLSNTVVALQEPKARRQSSPRSMLLESCRQVLTGFLSLLPNALGLMWDFSCLKISTKSPLRHFI